MAESRGITFVVWAPRSHRVFEILGYP